MVLCGPHFGPLKLFLRGCVAPCYFSLFSLDCEDHLCYTHVPSTAMASVLGPLLALIPLTYVRGRLCFLPSPPGVGLGPSDQD